MSLLKNPTSPTFFRGKGLNQFYLAVFIMALGESLINIFVPIYLYLLGFSIVQILCFYLLDALFFTMFSFLGSKITVKIGEKYVMLLSTPFLISYYLGLIFVDSYSILFFILPLVFALRRIFFNYGYHLNYMKHSQQSKQGRELALLGIITLLATMAAPYLGSLVATVNFPLLFIISSILIVLGTIPLFFLKDNPQKINFSLKSLLKKFIDRENLGNMISFSGYAVESLIGRAIWPIFLIIVIGALNKTGLIISLSMLISLLTFHVLGKLTDKIDKIKLLKIGTFLYVLAWIGRIFANTANKILFIDSYKNFSEQIIHLPWAAQAYDLARRENYFEFIVYREIVFNLIRIVVFPVLIVVFLLNFYPFIFSFVLASIFSIGYIFIKE
jgi:MFS family permease